MEKIEVQSTPPISSLYPAGWERKKSLDNGVTILIRPILPTDAHLYKEFMQKILLMISVIVFLDL